MAHCHFPAGVVLKFGNRGKRHTSSRHRPRQQAAPRPPPSPTNSDDRASGSTHHLVFRLPLLFLLSPAPRGTERPTDTQGAAGMGRREALAVLLAVVVLAASAAGEAGAAKAKGKAKGKYRALFNFGDSLADAGNLIANGVPDILATARLPYGQTYFGKPTGRCSDGRLVIDHLAQEFGLPLLPPSKANRSDLSHGANFAITGATALDTPYFEARGLGAVVWNSGALMTQIQWFRDLKPFFCNGTKEECKEFYANSLFVVGEFGGNDYNAPLFAGKGLSEAYKFMPDVIQGISDGVEELIAEGAVDLIVPGVMPTGCFPVYLNMLDMPAHEYGARSGCIRQYNTFSWVHNAHLKRALEKLRPKHPNVRIIYGDYYTPVVQFMLQPEKFG
ncbi:hypothetical protein VPH35_045096 [Triticum aestivum]